ncbi:MAG TPA: hypothetical protein VHV49_10030 [Pseudonocardiaceae bacterium]|nr:hypothetical protein [Pseudonocardiaceae bacterium]
MTGRQLDVAAVKTPTQLIAALIVLIIVVVPALITGAATIARPSWLPAVFGVAAVGYAPAALVLVYRLVTRHRNSLLNDDAVGKLNAQALRVAPRLDRTLEAAGLDMVDLIAGKGVEDVANDLRNEMKSELNLLLEIIGNLQGKGVSLGSVPAAALLEAAKGLMAQHRWGDAAKYLDEYAKSVDDWTVQWSRGVAYANQRNGITSDVAALRAYNEAIALAPRDADLNDRARLLGYRGAILKRLRRLDEAESDLQLATRWATRDYEITDITYNLACVYAMLGRKHEMILAIRSLRSIGALSLVTSHLDDYFVSVRDDPDFRAEIADDRSR